MDQLERERGGQPMGQEPSSAISDKEICFFIQFSPNLGLGWLISPNLPNIGIALVHLTRPKWDGVEIHVFLFFSSISYFITFGNVGASSRYHRISL